MENEEQESLGENIETQSEKPKSKNKLIVALLLVALAGWFVSSEDSRSNKSINYQTILAESSNDFYSKHQPGAIETELNLFFGGAISDDEKILIYRNIDLATLYLNKYLRDKVIFIDIFDDPQKLKSKLLKDIAILDYENDLAEDVMPGGFFMDNLNCDSSGSVGMTYSDYWADPSIVILLDCGWEEMNNGEFRIFDTDIFSHEIVHVAQETWFGKDNSYSSCFAPRWFKEGQAQFVSSRISTIDGTLDEEYFRTSWLDFAPNGALEDDESYESAKGAYSDGAFAVEFLVGKYGWNKILKLSKELNVVETENCSDTDIEIRFSKAFKKIYKISVETFYNDVKPYIEWNLKKLG